jgi:hypothetical protein
LKEVKFKLSSSFIFNAEPTPHFRAVRHKIKLRIRVEIKKIMSHLGKLNGLALMYYPYTGLHSRNGDI